MKYVFFIHLLIISTTLLLTQNIFAAKKAECERIGISEFVGSGGNGSQRRYSESDS